MYIYIYLGFESCDMIFGDGETALVCGGSELLWRQWPTKDNADFY